MDNSTVKSAACENCRPLSILPSLRELQHGFSCNGRNKLYELNKIREGVIGNSLKKISNDSSSIVDIEGITPFTRRITSIEWHPHRLMLSVASKFGDIKLIGPQTCFSNPEELKFIVKAEIIGEGAGAAVSSMKFHTSDPNLMYLSSLDGSVKRFDFHRPAESTFVYSQTTKFLTHWYTAMDISFDTNVLIAGDNKGSLLGFTTNGTTIGEWKIHKDKIHHCEFNQRAPHLLVTSSLYSTDAVKIWDFRRMDRPLVSHSYAKGVIVARFNPVDGNKLLTNDQEDEIKVLEGPNWDTCLTFRHHHKQFQHITPIKANWHPFCDTIVIGSYPKDKSIKKTIQFFDGTKGSGDLICETPTPLNLIASLNSFNPTGEYLAVSQGAALYVMKPSVEKDKLLAQSQNLSSLEKQNVSDSLKAAVRGRQNTKRRPRRDREFSPASSEDDSNEENKRNKKRPAKKVCTETSATTKGKRNMQRKK